MAHYGYSVYVLSKYIPHVYVIPLLIPTRNKEWTLFGIHLVNTPVTRYASLPRHNATMTHDKSTISLVNYLTYLTYIGDEGMALHMIYIHTACDVMEI